MDNGNMDEISIAGNKKVKDIRPGDKSIDILIIILQFIKKNKLKNDKHMVTYLVADETGCIQCNFYDSVSDLINEGDIILLKSAYASIFQKHLILYSGKPGYGQIIKVDEFFMIYTEVPNLSDEVFEDNEHDLSLKYQSNNNKHYDRSTYK